MADKIICIYNKYKYCKYGDRCNNVYVHDLCNKSSCDIQRCSRRHPPTCKFYNIYKGCKFGDKCSFIHVKDSIKVDDSIINKKLLDLENKLHEKSDEVDKLKNMFSEFEIVIQKLTSKEKDLSMLLNKMREKQQNWKKI